MASLAALSADSGAGSTTLPPHNKPPIDTAHILTDELNCYSKHFKAAHINAESLRGHIDEIRAIFQPQSFEIISISESWLKPSISSFDVSISGYSLFRNDRINKKCGGVAVYIKEHLNAKVIYSSPSEYSAKPEFMFIEIKLSSSEALLLGVCYRPPKIGHLTDFENVLLRYLPDYRHAIVMGDFNTDLLMTNKNFDYNQLTTMFESCNMTILPLNATHHTAHSDTLIDLIVVSDPKNILHSGQISIPGISKHDLIYCVSSFKSLKVQEKFIKYRDFKRIDEVVFLSDVLATPWHLVENQSTVDNMVDMLNRFILGIFDKHAPVVKKRINKKSSVPWLTQDILALMARRDAVYRKAKKTRDAETLDQYRYLRNRVKQCLRNSKARYINTLFSNKKQSSSDLWRNVKKLGFGKQPSQISVNMPLNVLNEHFLSFSQNTENLAISNHLSFLTTQTASNSISKEFHFKHILQFDTLRAIRRIRSNAMGSDNISVFLLKKILFAILPAVTAIYNASLQSGVFPSAWKSAIVRPLNKVASPSDPQDYRPISILPALSKGLERIVHCQITEFLKSENIFNSFQSGFRQHHSTETALLRITDDIRLAMDRRQCTILTLFDFSKAFDTVNHNVLISKLRLMKFSDSTLNWLTSYLSGRRQCVSVDDNVSDWRDVICGVPQGSILGPLLFGLYLNDISSTLKYSKFHCYADDLQIYAHCNVCDINDTVRNLNMDINRIVNWTKKHGLKLNPNKTKSIIIAYSRLLNSVNDPLRNIIVDRNVIPYCDKVKSLGLIINSTLDWTDHVVSTCKKIFAAIHTLKMMRRFLPHHIKLILVKSLVFPYFNYCNAVINDMSVILSNKLQRSQNYCLRFLFDLRRDDHITPYYIRLSTLKLADLRELKILSLLFLIIKNGFPQYFANDFQFLTNVNNARSSRMGSSMLRIPHHRTAIYNKSFVVTACRSWNYLPETVRALDSRAGFVSAVRKILLERMSAAADPVGN